jgi:hypothetical protein
MGRSTRNDSDRAVRIGTAGAPDGFPKLSRRGCDDLAGFMLEKCSGLGAISADHPCGLK